jgi:two-component system CheB/CheR fusion protein
LKLERVYHKSPLHLRKRIKEEIVCQGGVTVDENRQQNQAQSSATAGEESASFPVVGIGASAGGLGAFQSFLSNTPSDSGLAFVLVQHLSPDRESNLVEIAERHTEMEVSETEDAVEILPNRVYIIPPGKDLDLMGGRLHLMEPTDDGSLRLPIDHFFRSLADDQKERSICVILSGSGSDGTVGLKAIKEEGGMAMIQDPDTADYQGMPTNALETGLVDYVLPPEEMGQQLVRYVEHAFGPDEKRVSIPAVEPDTALQKIFILLRNEVGHDFSHYRQSSIRRRVERRMAVNQIRELDAYVRYLRENAEEIRQLFRELLISVTDFFRDPEAFEALEEQVIPRLVEEPINDGVRVWVPGCATGEEAYSIAILLREEMERIKKNLEVRIFATDIDSEAIVTARAGLYPNGIAADVSAERLDRFFSKEDDAFRVDKIIRDMTVFAEQNVFADPPFSDIDLISCRNLLIYVDSELQEKVLSLFHYSLRSDGFLFLGTSESLGQFEGLFQSVDKAQRIFRRKDDAAEAKPPVTFPSLALPETAIEEGTSRRGRQEEEDLRIVAERMLLDQFAPPSAIVNASGAVVYFHGRTGQYLEPAPGEASLDIERMAREGLQLHLSTALRRAQSENEPVRYQRIGVKTNGGQRTIDLTVTPVERARDGGRLFLVAFEDVTSEEGEEIEATAKIADGADPRIRQLEQELRAKEHRLQTTIEELETSNEELKSANEELQSSNEELQSTNEELETSQEELRSVNEELKTANANLEEKIEELQQANDDIRNMLSGTGVGTVFVDEDLNVRRFTPDVTEVLNLIDGDVGRPISHVSSSLVDHDKLAEDAKHVRDTLEPLEREVQTESGDCYLLRVMPYRTEENVVEGVVMTFVNVTSLEEAEEEVASLEETKREIEAARDYAQRIVETVREPLVILDADLRVVSANRSFYRTFDMKEENVEEASLFDLGEGGWDTPELRELLEEILPQETVLREYEVTQDFRDVGERRMMLNARELVRGGDDERLILLAFADVTEA